VTRWRFSGGGFQIEDAENKKVFHTQIQIWFRCVYVEDTMMVLIALN